MTTSINPVVHYRDLDAGARFLVETFGFVQHAVHKADDGSIQYVELSLNGAPLGLGPHTEGSMFDTGPAVVYISLDEVDRATSGASAPTGPAAEADRHGAVTRDSSPACGER